MDLMEARCLRPAAGEPLVIHYDALRLLQLLQGTLDEPVHLIIVSSNSDVLASP
jgi:hypothetical protein